MICNQCGKDLPPDDFYSQNKTDRFGNSYIYHNPKCKKCCSENSWDRNLENYEEHKRKNLEDYHSGKSKDLQKQASEDRLKNGKYSEWLRSSIGKIKAKMYQEKRKVKIHKISLPEWRDCKSYFDNSCAYCGISIDRHFRKYGDKLIQTDFHKEHVDNDGSNDLSNCIPSCLNCNTSKHKKDFEIWYITSVGFSNERYRKIIKWLSEDYKKYIECE